MPRNETKAAVKKSTPKKARAQSSKPRAKGAQAARLSGKKAAPPRRKSAVAVAKARVKKIVGAIKGGARQEARVAVITSAKTAAVRAVPAANKKTLEAIVAALNDAKALDITALDVRKLTDIADYMVIASGTSTRHVSSLADKVVEKLRPLGRRPMGIEGKDTGEWVLVDFGDIVVHAMRPQTRDFYNLEKLWAQDMAADKHAPSELELHIRARRNR